MFIKNLVISGFFALTIFSSGSVIAKSAHLSDEQVKQQIIEESINSYPGTCACPFNSARNGSRCGGRSAWSKEGGYAPICYEDEVTSEMISEWRKANNA